VIFVDAAAPNEANGHPGEVRDVEISAPQGAPRFSHQLSPAAVMALARQLFGATPRAFAVTLTADCFEHGEVLSPVVAAAIPALVTRIEQRIQSLLSSRSFPASPAAP
jgi:Ni,Fe-hydrogenase maturation factor